MLSGYLDLNESDVRHDDAQGRLLLRHFTRISLKAQILVGLGTDLRRSHPCRERGRACVPARISQIHFIGGVRSDYVNYFHSLLTSV
jgi:hypothetical protein